ncbi:hypothetical protein PVAG01_07743 [Phlyctema vagabunda]|uniref:Small ribosomal subunit protein mS33 n=1 Tax=Phlyctema vagabunda TaxID=108571 RepID=A0ABR4PDC8_9HELO
MSVARSRLLDLMKVQCKVFSTTFNPEGLRTGNQILRARLRGPSLIQYYPRKVATVNMLQKAYRKFGREQMGVELETWDEKEEDRLEHIKLLKARGKGAPKKKRTIEESKKFNARKR